MKKYLPFFISFIFLFSTTFGFAEEDQEVIEEEENSSSITEIIEEEQIEEISTEEETEEKEVEEETIIEEKAEKEEEQENIEEENVKEEFEFKKITISYDLNMSNYGEIFYQPSIRDLDDYEEKIEPGQYIIKKLSKDYYSTRRDPNADIISFDLKGWQIGNNKTLYQEGDTIELTEDTTLKAIWDNGYSYNGRAKPRYVNFNIYRYNGKFEVDPDNVSTVKVDNNSANYTKSVYSAMASPKDLTEPPLNYLNTGQGRVLINQGTEENGKSIGLRKCDRKIRNMTNRGISNYYNAANGSESDGKKEVVITFSDFPSDNEVINNLIYQINNNQTSIFYEDRNTKIRKTVTVEDLENGVYKIRWFSVKFQDNGWKVDGALVKEQDDPEETMDIVPTSYNPKTLPFLYILIGCLFIIIMRGKRMRKFILTLMMSLCLMFTMTGLTYAAQSIGDGAVNTSDTQVTIPKGVTFINDDVAQSYGPGITYTYTVAPASVDNNTTISDGENAATVYAGPANGLTLDNSSVTFSNSDLFTNGAEATKNINLSVSLTNFTKPGVYRYVITDTTSDSALAAAGIVRKANYDTTRYVDIFIKRDSNNNLTVYGYALRTDQDSEEKDSGFISNSSVEGTDGTDRYKTYNVTITKMVAGALGDVNHQFPFDVTVNNGGKNYGDGTAVEHVNLKHGDSFTIEGLAPAATVAYKETNDTQDNYSVTVMGSESAIDVAADYSIAAGNVSTYNFSNHAVGNTTNYSSVTYTNTLEEVSPTGFVQRYGIFVLILIAALALIVIIRKFRIDD